MKPIPSLIYRLLFVTLLIFSSTSKSSAQVTFLDSSVVTNEALYFWKADDPEPFHYGRPINPHGNCIKVYNGYVFYTWYRGGWSDRTLMVSRKKIGSGTWKHVELRWAGMASDEPREVQGQLSLVGGKGDTHLTTNVGICPIDGTVHIMYDHHNENLNYIRSKKGVAFGSDEDFSKANFLPQQNYLIPGKVVNGVSYPNMFNNDAGDMFFERRLGSAVSGEIVITYYDGEKWSPEKTIIDGRNGVTQGESNFCYGNPFPANGKIYYAYSPRWAESPTILGEGVYIMDLGKHMNEKAVNVDGEEFDLPVTDQRPFFIADPRSVPDHYGWAGGPEAAISPKGDIYLKIQPKNTESYSYLRKAGETEFKEYRNQGSLGDFYGNRMYKFVESGGYLEVKSCLAGTFNWETEYRLKIGFDSDKSVIIMQDGYIAAVYRESVNSPTVPIHCFVFKVEKSEYTPQTIALQDIPEKTESDAVFAITATATSKLPVTLTSSNPNIARIVEGNKVQIMGAGTCDIIANQPGNGEFDNAPEVKKTLVVKANVSKQNQTLQFSLATSTYVWGSGDINLSATATSGLAVSFESSDTAVAVIVDGKVMVKRAGKTMISALQMGNTSYNAAPIIGYELTVPKRPQVITFNKLPKFTSGDKNYNIVATSNNPNATLRYLCSSDQVAIVWTNSLRECLAAGNATITVSDAGDDFFLPVEVKQTITVEPKVHKIPTQIEAEYCSNKSGVNVTRWSNTVFYLNSWDPNDYAEYMIDVPADGVYEVEISAAAPSANRKLKIVSGTTTLATATLTQSPSLTNFKSTSVNINLKKGVQTLKIVGVLGAYNFDWFKITASVDNNRYVNFKNITDGQEIALGTNLTVEANMGSTFKEVSLWLNDTNLGTLTTAPFSWSSHPLLTNMQEAFYTFKLVAKDNAGETMEVSTTIHTPAAFELSDKTSLHISFEDEAINSWETDGNDYGVVPTIMDGSNTRAGSKVMALEYSGGTSGHHVQNIMDKIVVPDQYYFHMIAYTSTSDVAFGQTYPTAKLGDWAPTPTITGHAQPMVFERKITSRQNTKGDSLNCFPRLRSKANGGACVVYYDDIVLYAHNSETADVVSPSSAEGLILSTMAGNSMILSWTEGVDDLTGVTSTLILRTSNQAAASPELLPQVAYTTANDATGIATVGDWTVISTVPGGTTTFTDNTRSAGQNYKYAIVHKDLAYNYSSPLVKEDVSSAIEDKIISSYRCIGLKGAIELSNLTANAILSVYDIKGVKVFGESVSATELRVNLSRGVYIVSTSGINTKVVVK